MRRGDLVKLDMLINGDALDALSIIIHRDKAQTWGRELCRRLKELIPRQLFEVIIQGAIGSKNHLPRGGATIAQECGCQVFTGGDITRKRKIA